MRSIVQLRPESSGRPTGTGSSSESWSDRIAGELRQPLWPAVHAAVGEIRARHGQAVAAVLFYGSCLRDRADAGRLLDFYVFTERYRDFHGWSVAAALNRLLPPNVYYLELPFEERTVRAKYAVLSLAALDRQTARGAFLPTLWARLAQPCALPFARDAATADRIADALASAVVTLITETVPLLPPRFTPGDLWPRGFAETYRTELRPERAGRPRQLYEASSARYDALARWVISTGAVPGCAVLADGGLECTAAAARRRMLRLRWVGRRVAGRIVHVARLAKATLTFAGGLDYALWKIATHSGIAVVPTPWQRRHPLLAAPMLAWRLYRRGAFR